MTLEEIANKMGVSKSTVSRALSGKGRIGQKTRQEIIDFAKANGVYEKSVTKLTEEDGLSEFRVQANANHIYHTATRNLGVVFPSDVYVSGSPYFYECLLGIYEAASLMDYNVMVTTATSNDVSGILRLVKNGKIDGLILTRNLENEGLLEQLTAEEIPVGLTGQCDNDRVIQVDADNGLAAENLTSLLIGEGYRKFAMVVENLNFSVNRARYEGYCRGLLKSGISREQQEFYSGKLSSELLEAVMENVLARKVECIICGDDMVCTRLMSKLQSEGYRIPKDIAIASLYNSYSLDCFTPGVTSVNISARSMGNTIGKQMIQYLEGGSYQKKTIVDYEILLRKSTGRKKG